MTLDNKLRPINPQQYKIEGCFVDDDKRFAFIHIYKNASISFRNVMNMRGKYHKYTDVKDMSLDTVAILSNPIDRVVTAYLYLLRLEDNGLIEQHPTFLTKETEFFKIKDQDIYKSFDLYLDAIDGGNFYDAVTYPQVGFIRDRGLTINDINNVMIMERMETDFEQFKAKYNLSDDLVFPHDNSDPDTETAFLRGYVEEEPAIYNRIARIYKEDMEMYHEYSDRKQI